MSNPTHELHVCRYCQAKYLAVTWLTYRVAGYCSEECTPEFREAKDKKALRKAEREVATSLTKAGFGAYFENKA